MPSLDDAIEERELPPAVVDEAFCAAASRRRSNAGRPGGAFVQYVHIPKAGGTSIQRGLDGIALRHKLKFLVFNGPSIDGSASTCPQKATQMQILMGHRGYGFCRAVETSHRGLFTFTAFREPLSRMISMFDYNLKMRATKKAVSVFGKGASLNALVLQYNSTTDVVENGERILKYSATQMTRFMCGYECMGPNAVVVDAPAMRKRAHANLHKMDAVGLLHKLDELIVQLKFHIAFMPGDYKKWPDTNTIVKTAKSKVGPQAAAILLEWAALDVELYEKALEIYERKHDVAKRCLKLSRRRASKLG